MITCLFSCRATAFNRSSESMGNLCKTVPIIGSLAVLIKSITDEGALLLLLFDIRFSLVVLLLIQLAFLLPSFDTSLGCCNYR